MVYQPASVLSRDVDVALVTKGQCSIGRQSRNDTTVEKPNIRSIRRVFKRMHAFIEKKNLFAYCLACFS